MTVTDAYAYTGIGGGHQGHVTPLGNLYTSCAPPSNSYTTVRTYQKWNSRARQPCTWNLEICLTTCSNAWTACLRMMLLHCAALCVHWAIGYACLCARDASLIQVPNFLR